MSFQKGYRIASHQGYLLGVQKREWVLLSAGPCHALTWR